MLSANGEDLVYRRGFEPVLEFVAGVVTGLMRVHSKEPSAAVQIPASVASDHVRQRSADQTVTEGTKAIKRLVRS